MLSNLRDFCNDSLFGTFYLIIENRSSFTEDCNRLGKYYASVNFLNMSEAFVPPNSKEFIIAYLYNATTTLKHFLCLSV